MLRVVRVKPVAPNKYMGRRPIACFGNRTAIARC